MSYIVTTPCGGCAKLKEGCTDEIILKNGVGIIHMMNCGAIPTHLGAGNIDMKCTNRIPIADGDNVPT